eukprot:114623_1
MTELKLNADEIDDILDEIDKQSTRPNRLLKSNITSVNWHEILVAIKNNKVSYIKNLISSNDIDINEKNPSNGMTLLMYSVIIGNMDLIKLLINYGADVTVKDNDNQSALEFSLKYGRYKITELLYYQTLSGSLGKDLKNIATQIHDKNQEAQFFIKNSNTRIDIDLGLDSRSSTIMDELITFLRNAMKKRHPFSADLLYYCWYYIINKNTENNPLDSKLFKSIMKTYTEILENTSDKIGWKFLKEYILDSLIWYLPHPNVSSNNNEEQKEHKTEIDCNDDGNDIETTLKSTLFHELLDRVRKESKKQSDSLLAGKINKIKSEKPQQWNQLIKFNINTKYSANARQDSCGCLLSKYTQDQLSEELYPSSTHFSARKHYDTNLYLNQLLFNANIINSTFQHDMKLLTKQIEMENKNDMSGKISYRAGPMKTLNRSQTKVENDYINEEYPTAAKLLDLNRCALQFENIQIMMKYIEQFRTKIENNNSYSIVDIVRCKNGWCVYNEKLPAYTDIKLNVLVKTIINGMSVLIIAEVQLLLSLMSKFKKVAHKLYSVERAFEFVYNFSNLKKKMNTFTNNRDMNEVFISLVQTDSIKEFELFWDMIKPTNDTLTTVSDSKDSVKSTALVHIINNKNSAIFSFLTNNKNKNIYFESISQNLDKYGLIKMILVVGVKNATTFISNLFESINENDSLQALAHLSKSYIQGTQYRTIDWAAEKGYAGIIKILLQKYLDKTNDSLVTELLTKPPKNNASPLTLAIQNNNTEIAKELIEFCDNNKLLMTVLNPSGVKVQFPLLVASGNGNLEMVKFILDNKYLSETDKVALLSSKDKDDTTVLMHSCKCDDDDIGCKIFEELLLHVTDNKIKADLISSTNRFEFNCLGYAVNHTNIKMIQLIFENVKDYQQKLQIIFNQNHFLYCPLATAIQNYNKNNQMVSLILNNITTQSDKIKLYHLEHVFYAPKVRKTPAIIETLFKHIGNDIDVIFDLVTNKYKNDFSLIITAIFEKNYPVCFKLLDYFKTKQEKLIKILSLKYCDTQHNKFNELTYLLAICKTANTRETVKILQHVFGLVDDKTEMYKLLCDMEKYTGNTCMNYALDAGPTCYNIDSIKEILTFIITYYNKKQVLNLLSHPNGNGLTCFMQVCASKKTKKFNVLKEMSQIINDDNILKQLLNQQNKDGKNCYQIAKHFKNEAMATFIESYFQYLNIKPQTELDDDEKKTNTDMNIKVSPLIYACYVNKYEFIKNLLKIIDQSSNNDELMDKLLFNTIDINRDKGVTPLMIATINGYSQIIQLILNHIKNNNELLNKVISQKTESKKMNCLHRASQDGYCEIVKEILQFDTNSNKLVFDTDKLGNTCLMKAAYNNRYDVVKAILNHITDYNVRIKLLFHQNKDKSNILFYCLSNGENTNKANLKLIQLIFDFIENDDDKRKLIFETNKSNETCIFRFTKYTYDDKYKIIKFLLNTLNDEKIKVKLLSMKCDWQKNTVLMSRCYNDKELKLFETIINNLIDKESKLYLLNGDVNNKGKTCLQIAESTTGAKSIVAFIKQHV